MTYLIYQLVTKVTGKCWNNYFEENIGSLSTNKWIKHYLYNIYSQYIGTQCCSMAIQSDKPEYPRYFRSSKKCCTNYLKNQISRLQKVFKSVKFRRIICEKINALKNVHSKKCKECKYDFKKYIKK